VTDPTSQYSAFGETFENIPTAMVYDTFTAAASALMGQYVQLSRAASTSEERDTWWAKVLELRDLQHGGVHPDDRAALIEHIHRWRAELKVLRG
jgi:hypothetical protein